MRAVALLLVAALVAIQYPLWWGKGGWTRVWEAERQVSAQRDLNAALRLRNAALAAEVRDLQSGTDAIEERARQELGLVSEGETFVQFVDGPTPTAPAAPGQPQQRR